MAAMGFAAQNAKALRGGNPSERGERQSVGGGSAEAFSAFPLLRVLVFIQKMLH